MGLSRSLSEINGDFSQKSQFFPPRVFCSLAEGVPLGIAYSHLASEIIIMMGLPGSIHSAAWKKNTRTRQTDGQTNTGRQQRPRLRIASRGKNSAIKIANRATGKITTAPVYSGRMGLVHVYH